MKFKEGSPTDCFYRKHLTFTKLAVLRNLDLSYKWSLDVPVCVYKFLQFWGRLIPYLPLFFKKKFNEDIIYFVNNKLDERGLCI